MDENQKYLTTMYFSIKNATISNKTRASNKTETEAVFKRREIAAVYSF